MKNILLLLIYFSPLMSSGQLKVKTVIDHEGSTEGIWLDANCNLYFTSATIIRKIQKSTGSISTIAGTGALGFSGDNGPATAAALKPYGLFADEIGNVYIADADNNRIRKIEVSTGIITTFAGGGATAGDDVSATNAMLNVPMNVYGDNKGNIYIGERGRIRKVNTSGIITTLAGTGVLGYGGDGGQATSAQIRNPHTMLFDDRDNFYFADRGNHRIRKISNDGKISTYAGTTDGYSGDNGPATAAQLSGPISFVIDYLGNMVIGDNQNNCLRKVDAVTGIITTIAGVGPTGIGSNADDIPATAANIHPEFMYLDRSGNIYFSCFCRQIRKITNYLPSLAATDNGCGETFVQQQLTENNTTLFPNPATDELHLQTSKYTYTAYIISNTLGKRIMQQSIREAETNIPTASLARGVYLITLTGENGKKTIRFVKE